MTVIYETEKKRKEESLVIVVARWVGLVCFQLVLASFIQNKWKITIMHVT